MTPIAAEAPQRAARTKEWRTDAALCVLLFLGTVVLVGLTSHSVGFTRDEGYYFKAGEQYWGWFVELGRSFASGDLSRPFDKAVIDKHLAYNFEHPVLVKNLFALSYGLGKETFGVFEKSSTALRFPAWLFAGLSVSLLFALARSLLSRRAALLAALLFLSMPRAFWQMHLACFDIPVVAAHTWLVLAYLKGRRTVRGALLCGVAFGLAAAVKHNVLVAPAFFVLHWLLVQARAPVRSIAGFTPPPVPLRFFALALLGPLVFVAHWPYLWPDPLLRIGRYLGFHLQHEHYPILWFGELLTKPPFPVSFPFVMSAVTVPVPVLALLGAGTVLATVVSARFLWARLRRRARPAELTLVPLGDPHDEPSASPALLLLLNAAFPFALIALPSSPIFGGTKHWMNALPFLCVLGAWALEEGLARLARALPEARRRVFAGGVAFALLGGLAVLPGALQSARVHPYGLSSYNALVGFTRGAANIGFQRTFWGYEPKEVLPLLNERAPSPRRLHFGDTNHDSWRFYVRDGLLDKDLRWSGSVRGSSVAAVQPQGEFKNQWLEVLNEWGVHGPDEVVHLEGVPLLTVTFKP
jgi:4-amino-4-deoxy-L-arabinose transferase-like glycosyltransferase